MSASVIFSFDFEIGWGDVTNGNWRARERKGVYRSLRKHLPTILNCLDDHGIPASWATVGSMINAPKDNTVDHLPGGARDVVVASVAEGEESTFDGRDLFELVMSSAVDHEIISHTYTHVPFGYDGVDAAFVSREMDLHESVLKRYGLSTRKLVFPENTEKYYDVLKEKGIDIVRVPANNYFKNRYLYLLSTPFIAPPEAIEEPHPAGILRHSGSMLFNDAGNPHRIPLLNRRAALGIDHACSSGSTFHVWSHPFNFSESPKLLDAFLKLIEKIGRLQESGKIVARCM